MLSENPEPALLKTSNQTLKHHESNLSQKLHWEQRECISLMPGLLVHMKTSLDPESGFLTGAPLC